MAVTPTLRMLLTAEAREQTIAAGIDLPAAFETLVKTFAALDLAKSPTFEGALVEDIKTKRRIKDFESVIVGRFRDESGLLSLILASGDVIELSITSI